MSRFFLERRFSVNMDKIKKDPIIEEENKTEARPAQADAPKTETAPQGERAEKVQAEEKVQDEPAAAGSSKETMEKAVAGAYELAAQRYPEHKPVGVFGSSWILDPKLIGFTGEKSKITNLIRMFNVYPQKTGGKGPFGYVFPKNCDNYADLPEDTTLQRKMKQLYLDGDCIHEYAGVIVK